MKPRKVELVLAKSYLGHKVIIVKNTDNSSSGLPYSHVLIGGIDHCSYKVTAAKVGMEGGGQEEAKRSKIKSFVKAHNHS